jgi:TfoX/Sxy family transcriptional regulator of competence genes
MPDTAHRFATIASALKGDEGVTVGSGKRGFGSGALHVDGRIFAMVTGDRFVVKLPRQRVAALVESGDGSPFDAGKGRPMKEWVVLGDRISRHWLTLAREAKAFVAE